MTIRPAEIKDIPDMMELLLQVGKVHNNIRPDIFRPQPCKYSEKELSELLTDSSRPIFVADDGERVIGYAFCILQELKDDNVLCDQKSLYIDDLCVDSQCRGQHIGSALYDHVMEYARSIGCDTVTLNVWEGNDSARRFYESKGMRPRKTYMEIPCR